MSGTSLDGVDAALVAFDGDRLDCRATRYQPYPDDIRSEALALHEAAADEIHRAAVLANRLARAYAQTVSDLLAASGTAPATVRAVGCHGQTIRHVPEQGYTLQLNNPALLAELTGIAVVADFRSRDIAAGGQGAPLVPAFHDALFRTPDWHRIILNIGGIANLTDLAPDKPTRGFDCGPGNMLLDAWVQQHQGARYDTDGQWGRQGRVLPDLLARLMGHPYLKQSPPKSCGREQFNLDWLGSQLSGRERPEDVQATLTDWTAQAATDAIREWCGKPGELYVCGGGAHNGALMDAIARRLPGCRVENTAALGLSPDWVEAVAFAWLARKTLAGQAGNLAAVTGAAGPRILGAIYPA